MEMNDDILQKLYYKSDSPAFLGSVKKLLKEAKKAKQSIRKETVQAWLTHQNTHTLHRPVNRRFPRNHYKVFGINKLWEIDLIDFVNLRKENDDYKFILITIDVFSKFIFAVPLKNKTGPGVTAAFRKIIDIDSIKLRGAKHQPMICQSDLGKEFTNIHFKSFLKSRNIKQSHPYTLSLNKCAVVERAIRTIKNLLFKYFTSNVSNGKRYLDILPKIVHVYNHSVHRSIKMAPASVNENNVKNVYNNIINSHKDKQIHTEYFYIGQSVRIARKSNIYLRGYDVKWSTEIFKIHRIINKKPYKLFSLVDKEGAIIRERFYAYELTPVGS